MKGCHGDAESRKLLNDALSVFAGRQVTECGQYGLHMALRMINLSLQSSGLLLSAGRVERCSPSRRRHP